MFKKAARQKNNWAEVSNELAETAEPESTQLAMPAQPTQGECRHKHKQVQYERAIGAVPYR